MDAEWLERFVAEEAGRMRRMLTTIIAAAGLTRQDVDRELGRRVGTTSNVLTGRVVLKVEHVLGVLLVCGMHPSLIYQALYPQKRPFGPIEAGDGDPDVLAFSAGVAGDAPQATPPARPPLRSEPPPHDLPRTRAELDTLIRKDIAEMFAAYLEEQKEAARAEAKKRKRRSPGKGRSTKKPRR